jgi:hypothetical protein
LFSEKLFPCRTWNTFKVMLIRELCNMDETQQALDRLMREITVLEQMLQDYPPDITIVDQVVHGLEMAGDEITSLKYFLNPDHKEIGDDEE